MIDDLDHDVEIVGNRKYDNSLIYKCLKCGMVGVYLTLSRCGQKSGPRGRRSKPQAAVLNRKDGE